MVDGIKKYDSVNAYVGLVVASITVHTSLKFSDDVIEDEEDITTEDSVETDVVVPQEVKEDIFVVEPCDDEPQEDVAATQKNNDVTEYVIAKVADDNTTVNPIEVDEFNKCIKYFQNLNELGYRTAMHKTSDDYVITIMW